ncbi:Menaquinone via futalosine step 3 [Labilithrix luteola]|uniref:Multifunctional fusion protein n=1 Tax=Labilithrix luteola TaxID=1391654 RepID=A0A0K1Q2D3_9BACT|nr:cyclic dehypoxanthinyl futalosine synthase [Labilithrix luteola]AKU99892.1 Menaquinone via futalosine step 3 [Labilithrix luteola]
MTTAGNVVKVEEADRLRVYAVEYLNARPLWETLRDGPAAKIVDLQLARPSELARALAEKEADVGLLPVAAAATIGDLRLIRGMAIACRTKVRSVSIVSERPIHELTSIGLDLSSRTSVVLGRLLLQRRKLTPHLFGAEPQAAIEAVKDRTGALIIGDAALDVENRFPYRLDLAEDWIDWTGLPFVFAAWFARPGAVRAEHEELLRAAKREGLLRRDAIAKEHAARTGLAEASLQSYLRDSLCHDLGDNELRGMERFWIEAARAHLLPSCSAVFSAAGDAEPVSSVRRPISAPPPSRTSFGTRARPSLDALLSRAADGERLSLAEGTRLLREGTFFELGLAADAVRRRKHPKGVVTYIVDRNVNYTNVCTTSCRFCAFYRPVGHPEGYVLSREVLGKKLQEVVDAGGVQILLQGGLNPELPLTWYEDLFRWMKSEYKLGLHALSPEEIIHLSNLEKLPVRTILERLHAAGLDSVPGGGAEILVDRVRRKIAKTKCTSAEWLGVMRTAHQMGLRSSATMMYGTIDTPEERVQHLLKVRDLQDETGGFTAFFCWDFQFEKGVHILPGEHGTHLYLRTQAVARLMLDNVDHVGASWVTQGPAVGQVALRFGADDFGSVMFEENVVSSAGTTFGINADKIEGRIKEAGFRSVRRNVRYDWLTEPV